jgi:hypothetical protein
MDQFHGPSSWVYGIGIHLGSSNPRSTIRILYCERVCSNLISAVRARSDGWAFGSSRWRCGRMHMAAAPLELAWEGSGRCSSEGTSSLSSLKWTGDGGDSHPRQHAVGNHFLMACSGNLPPLSMVDGERWLQCSSKQGVGVGNFRGSGGTPRPDGGAWVALTQLGDIDGLWGQRRRDLVAPRGSSSERFIGEIISLKGRES